MANLDEAILLAVKAHHGQKDRSGEPYILHPLRLMFRQNSTATRIAAVLHDVVEDTEVKIGEIEDEFGSIVGDAVNALTRREPDETYFNYIARLCKNHP